MKKRNIFLNKKIEPKNIDKNSIFFYMPIFEREKKKEDSHLKSIEKRHICLNSKRNDNKFILFYRSENTGVVMCVHIF